MQPAIASGASLLLSILGTQVLFRLGVKVGYFHWLMIPGFFVLVLCLTNIFQKQEKRLFRFHEIFYYFAFFLVTILVSRASVATDFDGLFMHVEFVRALVEGWNPYSNPTLGNLDWMDGVRHLDMMQLKLSEGGYYLKYGQILESLLARSFGMEASKAINWLFAYFLFRSAFALFYHWHSCLKRALMYAFIVVLNPVIIYQIPSFKHDAMVACLISVMILSTVVFLRHRKWWIFVLYVVSAILLVGVKKSGLAYTSFYSAFFLFFVLLHDYGSVLRKPWVIFGGILLCGVGVILLHSASIFDFRPNVQFPFQETIQERGRLERRIKPASTFDTFPEYRDMNGFEQFVATTFCETNISTRHPHWKFPGKVTQREMQNLLQAFTGYWIGGMGPFYSLAFLIGMLAAFGTLIHNSKQLVWILYLFMPILWSVCLLPSLSVRWVPQIWFFCFGWVFLLEPVSNKLDSKPDFFSLKNTVSIAKIFRTISLGLILLNSSLIVITTVVGHWKIKRVIDAQFTLISQLNGPVKVVFDWFPSNRFWFIDRNVDFEVADESDLKSMPFFHLYRTNTRVHLCPSQEHQLVRYPGISEELPLDEALLKLERSLSKDAYTWHWIKPIRVSSNITQPEISGVR